MAVAFCTSWCPYQPTSFSRLSGFVDGSRGHDFGTMDLPFWSQRFPASLKITLLFVCLPIYLSVKDVLGERAVCLEYCFDTRSMYFFSKNRFGFKIRFKSFIFPSGFPLLFCCGLFCLFVFVLLILVIVVPVVVFIYCCFCPFLPLSCCPSSSVFLSSFSSFFCFLSSFFLSVLPPRSSSSFFLSSAPCFSCFYSSSYFFFIDVTTPSQTRVTDRVLLLSCLLNST